MSDYIDRNAAMDLFLVDPTGDEDEITLAKGCENYILRWVQNKLAALPVFYDTVEVVRCKYCKNFDPNSSVCKYSGWLMDGDFDFCSRGKKRDNENDGQ